MKLFVCGDVVNHTPRIDFIGKELSLIIQQADYSVCNFEGAELKQGQHAHCPHQEPGTAAYLRKVGFDLMLLANNHITELGREAVNYSIDTIKATGADCMGAGLSLDETYRPLIKDISGDRYGFINVCEAQVGQYLTKEQPCGYAWMGYENLLKDVAALKNVCDSVIVFVHAGLEHYSIPLPEIRVFYRRICDAGATSVIGGHTHSAQGYEYYSNKLIVYSLGNFFFPYPVGVWPEESISYSLIIELDKNSITAVTPIHHFLLNGRVVLQRNIEKQINLESLCEKLADGYEDEVRKMCEDAYSNLCNRLLAEATCGEPEGLSFFQRIKRMVHYTIKRKKLVDKTKKYRDSLILRLFENETYRWTIVRALKNRDLTRNENK